MAEPPTVVGHLVRVSPNVPRTTVGGSLSPDSDAMTQRVKQMTHFRALKALSMMEESVKKQRKRDESVAKEASSFMPVEVTSIVGLRVEEGVGEYLKGLEERADVRARQQEKAAELLKLGIEEEEVIDERPPKLQIKLVKAPKRGALVIRAQMPGWDPARWGNHLLDLEATKFAQIRAQNIKDKKSRRMPKQRDALMLQRPGPVKLQPRDYISHYAKSEGLTIAEWCREKDQRGERDLERSRLALMENQRRALLDARDPKPPPEEYLAAEDLLVRERRGVEAVEDMERSNEKTARLWRVAASALTTQLLLFRRWLGFGKKKQDLVKITHDLYIAPFEWEVDDELGITHVVNCSPTVENRRPEDFIYCTVKISESPDQAQDYLRGEFEMSRQFILNAHSIGGRVLVTCPTGANRSIALVIAFFMWEKKLALSTAYSLLKLHEPGIDLYPCFCLLLAVLEVELTQSSSVAHLHRFNGPTLKSVVGRCKFPKRLPWPLAMQMVFNNVEVPDMYALYFGTPYRRPPMWSQCYLCCPCDILCDILRLLFRCPGSVLRLLLCLARRKRAVLAVDSSVAPRDLENPREPRTPTLLLVAHITSLLDAEPPLLQQPAKNEIMAHLRASAKMAGPGKETTVVS